MAVLIPETPKDCPNGERIVYERLGRELDDDWIVLHSLGLTGHESKLWGEIDLVVLSTKGIFAIEVKGGRVDCHDGVWTYSSPNGQSYSKREDPWTQAKDAMFALRKRLLDDEPGFRDLLFGFGVVMPHERFGAQGPEIEPAVLLDKRDFRRNLGFYIGDLMRHWSAVYRDRHGREPALPTLRDIRRIRTLLRPDVESAFSLGSWFNGLESELLQLTNGQIRAARGVANNPRTVIRGRAGTGKTVIAIDRARQLAAQGCDVLYLCFNRMLARHVESGLGEVPAAGHIQVRHIHSLFREAIEQAGFAGRLEEANTAPADLFSRVFPELFIEAAMENAITEAEVLIVDEAQDVLTAANLDALDVLVRGGLRRGRWHLFLDPMQNIYGTEADAAEARLREAGFAEYDLFDNCRNTRQVATQCSIISGIDMALEGALEGPECECRYYSGPDGLLPKLEQEVAHLLAADAPARDMVILSTHRFERSSLAGVGRVAGLPLVDMNENQGNEGLLFSTMHAFKGLERNVVLAIDLDRVGEDTMAMLHYAGLSRARALLRAFIDSGKQGTYDAQARAFGRRMVSGAT